MDMDKFDETMRNIKDLSPDDKKKKMDAFLDKCACPTCPTYTECSKNDQEGIFCLMGNSFRCINEIKGCNCPTCLVENDLTMKDNMYCMRGSEFENRYMSSMR
jgi:hypothetical protein